MSIEQIMISEHEEPLSAFPSNNQLRDRSVYLLINLRATNRERSYRETSRFLLQFIWALLVHAPVPFSFTSIVATVALSWKMSRYTLKDVSIRNGTNSAQTWIVVNDFVYDVTSYMEKHPGGSELVEEYAGKDATAAFDEFGHSSHAKSLLKRYLVGELVEEDKRANRKKKNNPNNISLDKSANYRRRPFLRVLSFGCTA